MTAFETSGDTKTLAHVLRGIAVGGMVTYEELSAAIARDVQRDGRSNLRTARNRVLTENDIVFEVVRDVGLRRLADPEILTSAAKDKDRIRRTSRRGVKKVLCIDYDSLSRDDKTKHNTALSMFSVVAVMVSNKSIKRLSIEIEEAGTELPAAKATLAALGLKKN